MSEGMTPFFGYQRAEHQQMKDLTKLFDVAMFKIYHDAKTQAGYTASIFFRMLNERGGLSTAKYLINSAQPSDGYTELFQRGRLDLTVEAMVVEEPKWHQLFSDEELEKSRRRLEAYGYTAKNERRLR